MPLSLLPSLLLQILIVGYTPGPANIYSLAMSFKYGRRQSLVMWFGLLTGFSIAVCLMAVLAHCIGIAFAGYIQYLKYLGAAYILLLAYKVRKNRQESGGKHDDCSFTSGMLVQMTNAKMLLFDLTAFSTFVLPYSNELADLLAVGAWLLIAGPGANLLWLAAGSCLRRFFTDYQQQAARISSITLALCAVYIALA
ncbi:lysine transporter LysE [Prevotella denticola DNF00960]|uniref:LysE family transporter n=1 Tax=Prevotella denticola TaxID=28129 RepID=UPI00051016C3|nr:LysE family transporter [Prevotella denticola]KGF40280.1 lysine transporter LysE [Prevotella denticola DNF00960]